MYALKMLWLGSKNSQRLGSVALLVELASASRAATLQDLTSRFVAELSRRTAVPESDRESVQRYLAKRNLNRKYASRGLDGPVSVEVQDFLLADPTLPSGTGAEKEDTRATVDLAAQLGLVWPADFRRTWAGSLLVDWGSNVAGRFRLATREKNPYRIDTSQRLVFAWRYIERDLTFLPFLLRAIRSAGTEFSFNDVASEVRATLGALASQLSEAPATPENRLTLGRLKSALTLLSRDGIGRKAVHGGVTEQTVRRAYEQLLLPRLEILVDLGVLTKVHPLDYLYRQNAQAVARLAELSSESDGKKLDSSFFRLWGEALDGMQREPVPLEERIELLRAANLERHNQMGYTQIEEGLLCANRALMVHGAARALEFEDAVDALTNRSYSAGAYRVLTSVDRNRRLAAYKTVER